MLTNTLNITSEVIVSITRYAMLTTSLYTMEHSTMSSNLLKKALRTNSVFSLICAADLLLFSKSIANMMGEFDPTYLIVLGIGLIIFALFILYISERNKLNLSQAKAITFMDGGWIAGSILLIIYNPAWLSATGLVLIAAVGVVVTLCAYFQTKGIQKIAQEGAQYGQLEVGQ